jgi:inorganic phosphate transporter, PiT family
VIIITKLIYYIGPTFLGWGLGANDSANVFGTAVGSRMVKYRVAVLCTAVFVILGGVLQGQGGIETLAHSLNYNNSSVAPTFNENNLHTATGPRSGIMSKVISKVKATKGLEEAMIMSLGAALAVFAMTLLKLPVSTSQAVVGAIMGVGVMKNNLNFDGFGKILLCWIGTPIGSAFFTVIFYFLFRKVFTVLKLNILQYDTVIRFLLIIAGCYGAYALGANNVANVAAVFVNSGSLTATQAAWFGSFAIAFGVITYSKPVMNTVGLNIVKLNAFMAFITVLSLAVTVYIYALIGVPVSTTQAIVGAVFGLGLIKGTQTVNFNTIGKIAIGWIFTPICGGVLAAFGFFVSNLYYL